MSVCLPSLYPTLTLPSKYSHTHKHTHLYSLTYRYTLICLFLPLSSDSINTSCPWPTMSSPCGSYAAGSPSARTLFSTSQRCVFCLPTFFYFYILLTDSIKQTCIQKHNSHVKINVINVLWPHPFAYTVLKENNFILEEIFSFICSVPNTLTQP